MFRNRASQKPSDDFYLNFKADFPTLGQGPASTAASQAATSLAETSDGPLHSRSLEQHDIKDADPTPKGSNEPWSFATSGLTPSIMDPLNHQFSMFSHQMPGYYTPTPGGTNTLYHHQAGDLHTPRFGIGLGTPLSMPTSEGTLHAGQQAAGFQGFNPHFTQHVQQQQFHNIDPFHIHHPPQQQQTFPPHQFTHQPSYEHRDPSIGSPMRDTGLDVDMQQSQHQSPEMLMHPQSFHQTMQPPPPVHPSGEKYHYHVTLNAPTAMIKHSDEIPVTYLNKGQAYTLNVADTRAQQPVTTGRYRTFVRISFDDEQQRQRPSACWQLWKEGRGTNEAHQRGGRLQAVEYVESTPFGSAEDPSKPRIELESASFDGFCVNWSPATGTAECPISVRFNFLSTDFSHSKGVKGIPVRLCAKTELLGDLSPTATTSPDSEVCYCKVKLFRDHGAERKLSNDVAHVKKTIDKLNQQIAHVESGTRELGKRKRSGSISKAGNDQRPGKVPKHRRTWSMSSVTSGGGRGSADEDLHMKLMALQDMFTSTRPASVLYLRGAAEDDPDLNPVRLNGEPFSLVGNESTETASWERQSTQTGPPSSLVSPSPSSNSLSLSRRDSNLQQPTPFGGVSRVDSGEWRSHPQTAIMDIQLPNLQQLASPLDNQAVKIQTRSPNTGTLSGWIEALDVDSSYQPPPERPIKPVACFYVQPRVAGRTPPDNFHRAIYLMNRTLKDFVNVLATKCNIEPTKVLRTIRISRQGLHVLFDDGCIRELPEGQDMTAEFCEITPESPMRLRPEWDSGPIDIQCDGDVPTVEDVNSSGFELKLLF